MGPERAEHDRQQHQQRTRDEPARGVASALLGPVMVASQARRDQRRDRLWQPDRRGCIEVVPAVAVVVAQHGRLAGATYAERKQFKVEMTEGVAQCSATLDAPGRREMLLHQRLACACVGNSGNAQRPPQMPAGGRFSSSTFAPRRAITTQISRCGRALRGFAAGNACCSSAMRARHRCCNGQIRHAGFDRVQIIAPRSMIACVYERDVGHRRALLRERPEFFLDRGFAWITRRQRSSASARASRCRRGSGAARHVTARVSRPPSSGRCREAS